MSNHKIIFYGDEETETDEHTIECFWDVRGLIWIEINTHDSPPSYIRLDKPTAIKFAKTLRTEINKIVE